MPFGYYQFPRNTFPEKFQQLELIFLFHKKKMELPIKRHRHLESQGSLLNTSDFQTKAMALVTFGYYSNSGNRKKIRVCWEGEDLFGVVPTSRLLLLIFGKNRRFWLLRLRMGRQGEILKCVFYTFRCVSCNERTFRL